VLKRKSCRSKCSLSFAKLRAAAYSFAKIEYEEKIRREEIERDRLSLEKRKLEEENERIRQAERRRLELELEDLKREGDRMRVVVEGLLPGSRGKMHDSTAEPMIRANTQETETEQWKDSGKDVRSDVTEKLMGKEKPAYSASRKGKPKEVNITFEEQGESAVEDPRGQGPARAKQFLPSFRTEHSKPELDEMAANYNTGRTAVRPQFIPTEESGKGHSGYLNKSDSGRIGMSPPLHIHKENKDNCNTFSLKNPVLKKRGMPPLNTMKIIPYNGSPTAVDTCLREMSGMKEKERRELPSNLCSNLSKAFGKVSPINQKPDTDSKLTQTQLIKRSRPQHEEDILIPKFTLRTDAKASERKKLNKLSLIKNWKDDQPRLSAKETKKSESRSQSRGGKKRAKSSKERKGKKLVIDEAYYSHKTDRTT
jgi:hypothetical protein